MEACKCHQTSTEENAFSEDIGSLIKYAQSVNEYIDGNINDIQTHVKSILKEAEAHRDKLIKQVNESFKMFNTEIVNKVQEQKAILTINYTTLKQIVQDLSSMLERWQQVEHSTGSKQKIFLNLQRNAEEAALAVDNIKRLELKTVNMTCAFNMSIQPLVVSKSKFGEVSVETSTLQCETPFPDIRHTFMKPGKDADHIEEPEPAVMETTGDKISAVQLSGIDKINIKMADDTRDCYIRGIDMTDEGNIIIADFNNSKIKLYAPDGNVLSSLKLSSKPKEVTVIKGSQAVISMLGKQMCKQIGIIDIGGSGHLSWKGTIKTTYAVGGIASYKNNLIITCDESDEKLRAVQMIDMDGKVVWTVTKDKHGNHLFDFGRFLTTRCSDEGDTLFVTDVGKQSITVIDALTGEVVKVCNVKAKEPRGVCVDCRHNVYVCYKSGEISVWSRDMSEERCLVNDPEQLYCPLAMVYDRRRSELLVSSSNLTEEQFCNFIHRYKS